MYTLIIARTCHETPTEVNFPLSGCDAAYAAFRMACELYELTGGCVSLIDAETAEVLANNSEDSWGEDEDLGIPMPEPEDLTEPWWEG